VLLFRQEVSVENEIRRALVYGCLRLALSHFCYKSYKICKSIFLEEKFSIIFAKSTLNKILDVIVSTCLNYSS